MLNSLEMPTEIVYKNNSEIFIAEPVLKGRFVQYAKRTKKVQITLGEKNLTSFGRIILIY